MSAPWDLPAGADAVRRDTIELVCRACLHSWEARTLTELGRTDVLDSDGTCPDCGSDVVVDADDPLARVPLDTDDDSDDDTDS